MFRLADLGQVWWPVPLQQNGEDGQPVEATVHLLLRIYTRAELRERERETLARIGEGLKDGAKPQSVDEVLALAERGEEATTALEAELLERVTDWRGIGDGDTATPYSREALAALLQWRPIFQAFNAALYTASREAYRKNSEPGPAGTPARVLA